MLHISCKSKRENEYEDVIRVERFRSEGLSVSYFTIRAHGPYKYVIRLNSSKLVSAFLILVKMSEGLLMGCLGVSLGAIRESNDKA